MGFGVYAVYLYSNGNGNTMSNEVLNTNFRPNTPNGLKRIEDMIKEKNGLRAEDEVVILNLMPINNDSKMQEGFEYDME